MAGKQEIWETKEWADLKANAAAIESTHLRELLKASGRLMVHQIIRVVRGIRTLFWLNAQR